MAVEASRPPLGDAGGEVDAQEHALVAAAASGDSQAFEQLYRRHVSRIYGLCWRLCNGDERRAEQAVQDAFVRAWEKLGSFRGESRFGTWLHRVAVNVVMDEQAESVETPMSHAPQRDLWPAIKVRITRRIRRWNQFSFAAAVSLVMILGGLLVLRTPHQQMSPPPVMTAGSRYIEEHRALKPDAKVSVTNVTGAITVEAWDRNELRLTGELAGDVEKLEISGDEANLRIEVKLPKRVKTVQDTVLRLQVPVGASILAEAVSADIAVHGVRGDVRVNSVSGDIRLRGQFVSALSLKTVSGDIECDATLNGNAQVKVETASGDVVLSLPAASSASVVLKTYSGELVSAFGSPGPAEGAKRYEVRIGAGQAKVELSAFSGDIRLKKR